VSKRPLGVTIFGIASILAGLLRIYFLTVGLLMARLQMPASSALLSLGMICAGVGLLLLTKWAWWFALLVALMRLVWIGNVAVIAAKAGANPVGVVVGSSLDIVLYGVMIGYLLRPSVKAQFETARSRS